MERIGSELIIETTRKDDDSKLELDTPSQSMGREALGRKFASVALSAALMLGLTTTACQPEVDPHKCDQEVALLGDSRHRREGDVIPETSNQIFGRTFGNIGETLADGSKQYVEYFAKDGTVHEQHAAEIKAFAAKCSAKERPIILDFMGANYAIDYFSKPADMTSEQYQQYLVLKLKDFYTKNTPNAKVVFNEFFFGMNKVEPNMVDSAIDFTAMYNRALQELAKTYPAEFFFQAKPKEVEDGKISFVDAFHPTSQAISDLSLEQAKQLDDELLQQILDAGSSCAILGRPDFSSASAGEMRFLFASLRDLNPKTNSKLLAFLKKDVPTAYQFTLSGKQENCTALL